MGGFGNFNPEDFDPENFDGSFPEDGNFPQWGEGEMPNWGGENGEMPSWGEGEMPNFDGEMPDFSGERPDWGGENGEMPNFGGNRGDFNFENFAADGETKTYDLSDAHISVEIDGGKASGTLEDLVPGSFVTITVNGKGQVTYVLIAAQSGFIGGRNGRSE